MASFLLGYSSGGSATTPARTAAAVRYTALHFDDTFRITAKLTLNLGLRWQVDGPFSERYDRITWFDGNELNVAQPTPVNTVAGLVPAVPVRGTLNWLIQRPVAAETALTLTGKNSSRGWDSPIA